MAVELPAREARLPSVRTIVATSWAQAARENLVKRLQNSNTNTLHQSRP
jgi:hypothetical protein